MNYYKKFAATLTGHINGQRISLQGCGTCSDTAGVVDGDYQTSGALAGFDPLAFNAFIVTGYPSESQSIGSAINPFKQTDYSYDRVVEFDDGKKIELHTECTFKDGELQSNFSLAGEAAVPALETIEPLVETWVPLSKNKVKGYFTMIWKTKDKNYITGRAQTVYHIPRPNAVLESVHHRLIEINSEGDAKSFKRYQTSRLWKAADLKSVNTDS